MGAACESGQPTASATPPGSAGGSSRSVRASSAGEGTAAPAACAAMDSSARRTLKRSSCSARTARQLAAMFQYENPIVQSPTDDQILAFSNRFGLLVPGKKMYVRDIVLTCKYLHLFADAIDRGDKLKAREVFNDAVVPGMTVRVVGSKSGRLTANWKLEVEPVNLIALAWLQIAAELTTGRAMKKCNAPDCLEWFSDRSNKRFCNNRCKMAFHRQYSKDLQSL